MTVTVPGVIEMMPTGIERPTSAFLTWFAALRLLVSRGGWEGGSFLEMNEGLEPHTAQPLHSCFVSFRLPWLRKLIAGSKGTECMLKVKAGCIIYEGLNCGPRKRRAYAKVSLS